MGKTVHRPRNIHHKEVFAGRYHIGRNAFGRFYHGEEEVLVLALVEQYARFHIVAAQLIVEYQVAIATLLLPCPQSETCRILALEGNVEVVRGAACALDGMPVFSVPLIVKA
jgi:hypothetical protein